MLSIARCGSLLLILLVLFTSCARSPEARKVRHLERGDSYFKKEKYREAVLEYTNALRIENTNGQAIRQLGFAHYALGEPRDALRYLVKAEGLEPENTEVRLKLGHVYLAGGRPADARARAEAVLQRLPKNLDALVLVAGAARTPEEIAAITRRLEASRAELEPSAKYHLTLAALHLRAGSAGAAENALQEAVNREPESLDTHTALGNFYAARHDTIQAERELKAAAALAEPGSQARLRLADYYVVLGRRDEAKDILAEITAKAPDFLPAWQLRANIAFNDQRIQDSLKAVQVVLRKSPGDVAARTLLGRIHLVQGQTQEAITEFQRILKNQPRLAPVQYQLALAHLRAGNIQQAKSELREAVASAPDFAEATLLLAELSIQSGAATAAIDDLEKLVRRRQARPEAYALLATAHLKNRDPSRALAVARQLGAGAPKDPRGPYVAGLALLAQGKRLEARRELEVALSLGPGFVDPLARLVALDLEEKQPEAAVDRVKKQAALVPGSAAHETLLGNLYMLKGDFALAEAALLKAIDLAPHQLDAYVRLGSLYARSQRYDDALTKLREAARANPGDPVPLMMAGVVHEQKGDIPKAREAYENALGLNPRLVPAANNLAWLYAEHGGDHNRALSLAQTAKELSPDDPRISDTLGWILYRRGAYQRALGLLKESAGMLPDNPQVQYHLGMAYARLGDKESARRALALAVSSPEAFHGKEEAKQTLAALR